METVTGSLDITDTAKWFDMTGNLTFVKCPKCGVVMCQELVDVFEYPGEGDLEVGCYCEGCDIELGRQVKIKSVIVTLEVDDVVMS